jgi:HSP20 family protein
MARDEIENWMWSEAVDMLSRAERLHRQLFQPCPPASPAPAWEPPVDMLETEREVIILAALPGVDPKKVTAVIEGGVLVVTGRRTLPPELRTARIHRLELPQGRFERRVALPPGHYDAARSEAGDGCLIVTLRKVP